MDPEMSQAEADDALADVLAGMSDDELGEFVADAEAVEAEGDDAARSEMSRFDRLVAKLRAKGIANPEGLARKIGIRKYGKAGYEALTAAGRAKKKAASAAYSAARASFTHPDEILRYERTWPLEDIEILRSGDGRTVEAYAAVWETPAEVRDQHGHYMEVINRSAFDKTIRERGNRPFPVFYNHGMTAGGTPSDAYSVPIGRSMEVRSESRGLWTLSRYNDGPDADRVLEAIRNGAITGQSFRGRVFKSDPMRVPAIIGGRLPTITRTELGLSEYGPTASAVYEGASILALRSQTAMAVATLIDAGMTPEEVLDLYRTDTSTTPWEPETSATSDLEAGTDEPPVHVTRHSSRDITRRIQMAQISRRKFDA